MKGPSKKSVALSPERTGLQFAALPWRRGETLQVLLVTSRETRRWVIPKGWPIKGRKPRLSAAREALEEAGVTGSVGKQSIGAYHYVKRLKNGAPLVCRVEVFPLKVEKQRKRWPEHGQRMVGWFKPAEAAALVQEPELQRLLASFDPPADRQEARPELPDTPA